MRKRMITAAAMLAALASLAAPASAQELPETTLVDCLAAGNAPEGPLCVNSETGEPVGAIAG